MCTGGRLNPLKLNRNARKVPESRSLRILFVSLNFSPEETATGKYTGELAQWLAARGHAVDAIAGLPHYPEWRVQPGYAGKGLWKESLDGVTVLRTPHPVPASGSVSAKKRILMELGFSFASLYWWSRIVFSRRRYNLVIAICPPLQTAVMPAIYGALRGVPWVLHVQDFQVDAALRLGMLKMGKLDRLLFGLENLFLRRATRVSSITPSMCRRAAEKGASVDRTWLTPNWADITQITPGDHDNGFRRELGVGNDGILVMYAGAIATKQGLDVLLEAAHAMKDDDRFHFVIVGNGSDRERLESRAAELGLPRLRFLDLQPRARLNEMLGAADIHLVIQKREAADLVMPSKLTNILAAGRPAIATADQGTALWDALEDGGCGVCVPPGDSAALAEALSKLGNDADTRDAKGLKARRYAEENLDQDAILHAFEQKLFTLVGPKSNTNA